MSEFVFNIGTEVHGQDGPCGKLVKVVVDPHTHRVTDLIVKKGLLQKEARVLPVTAVEHTTESAIHLSIRSDAFGEYPEYREIEFEEPAADGKDAGYSAKQMRYWVSQYGGVFVQEPLVPMVRQRVHEGISPDRGIIGRGTPVHHLGEEIAKIDHVLVHPQSGEILHFVVRRGLLPDWRILPMDVVKDVGKEGVCVKIDEDELAQFPRYRPRAEADILAELRDRLAASELDFSGVTATLRDGIACLTGLVGDVASKRRAEATARQVEGVLGIENVLDTDTAIVGRVALALLDDPRTSLAMIYVLSTDGIVTLEGSVDHPSIRDAATEVAAEQDGVVEVVNRLEVHPDQDTEALRHKSVSAALRHEIAEERSR